jgi:RNA polymerase sigma-70 factor (ECF subfamily)
MGDFGARIWYNRGVDNVELEEAFLKFRERLERLAAQTLPPVLSRRVSPEDVVQETMVAVSRDNSPFMSNPDLPLYFKLRTALLQTIAQIERRNLAAEKRDAYREVEPQAQDDDDPSQGFGLDHFPDTATSPLSRITRQDRHAILRQGLMRLEDSDRAILELRHEEGLGNGECAALLGISEKAASLRYVRALKRLKDVLGEYSEFQP